MRQSWFYKWFLPIIGTVILGAIGSGVWEAALKPGLSSVTTILLDVATLGIGRVRDVIYLEIAKGNYERASLQVILILYGSAAFVGGLICLRFVQSALRNKDSDQLDQKSRASNLRGGWIACLTLGLISGYFLVASARTVYIVRASNNIEQFQRIVAPAITADERISLTSRVAQISSKKDYEKIIGELSAAAKKNGLRIPEFDIY